MKLTSMSTDQIIEYIGEDTPEIFEVLVRVREAVPWTKREIGQSQAAVLYQLTQKYNQPGSRILEIGTAHGWSAGVMAEAAPLAHITTMTPNQGNFEVATYNLRNYSNIEVICFASVPFLQQYNGPDFDMIFVDGDHKNIRLDLPYWNLLYTDGLFFHHDYSPAVSSRPCPPVYKELNKFGLYLGRDRDVLIMSDTYVGMIGWYRQADDPDFEEVAYD